MKTLLFISLVALASAATASAQKTAISLGLRGGGQLATSTVASSGTAIGITSTGSNYSYSTDKSFILAWQAGVVAEINFGKLAIQPALLFSQKGENFHTLSSLERVGYTDIYESTHINRYNWLELPIDFVYTLHGDHGLQFFAGPYVAWAVSGHFSSTFNDTNPSSTHTASGPISLATVSPNRSFDAGANFGVGYRQGPLQVHLGYQLGMRNLHQFAQNDPDFLLHDFFEDAAYNRMVQLTGTYFFNL